MVVPYMGFVCVPYERPTKADAFHTDVSILFEMVIVTVIVSDRSV